MRPLPTNKDEAEEWVWAAQGRVNISCPACHGKTKKCGEEGEPTKRAMGVLANAGFCLRAEIEAEEYLELMKHRARGN